MGTKGTAIVGVDVAKLLKLLNKAYADEWLAYYQYWIGAKVIKGPLRGAVAGELAVHAGEELKHAGMLAERIIQLGGTPLLAPTDWFKESTCGYAAPADSAVKAILEQNLKGERCAIAVYQKLLEAIKSKDHITAKLFLEILEDEVEHEEDLENFLEDIALIKKLV
jgi:bacterioferritin